MRSIQEQEEVYLRQLLRRISASALYKKDIVCTSLGLVSKTQLMCLSLRFFLSDAINQIILFHGARLQLVRDVPRFDSYVLQKEQEMVRLYRKLALYTDKLTPSLAPLVPREPSEEELNLSIEEFEELLQHSFFDGIFLERGLVLQSSEFLEIQDTIDRSLAAKIADLGSPPPFPEVLRKSMKKNTPPS